MGFVKVVKNKAYYKRYETKFRRRRESKTDYYARQRLIIQDKNKYKTPKYRFVVRFTNKDVICQVFSADLTHDVCVASAYSHELKRYGIKVGFTNYAAAYATGLLLARRINAKYNLKFNGVTKVDGADFLEAAPEDDSPDPFKANLDVGLARTTTGARIFGALKGAVDGGLHIPHTNKRFPGSKLDDDGNLAYDPEVHRKYIFGGHVKLYMESLADDEEAYKRQFAKYIALGISADGIEALWANAHKAIRADPNKKRDPKELGNFQERKKPRAAADKYPKKDWKPRKISVAQRKARIRQKLSAKGVNPIGPLVL